MDKAIDLINKLLNIYYQSFQTPNNNNTILVSRERVTIPEKLNDRQKRFLKCAIEKKSYTEEFEELENPPNQAASVFWRIITHVIEQVYVDSAIQLGNNNKVGYENLEDVLKQLSERLGYIQKPKTNHAGDFIISKIIAPPPNGLIVIEQSWLMGKTSVIQWIIWRTETKLIPVYLSFRNINTNADTFSSLDNLLTWIWDELSKKTHHQGLHIDTDQFAKNFYEIFLKGLEIPLVLCLDDVHLIFQNLELAKEFFEKLRSWQQEYGNSYFKNLRLVIASARRIRGMGDISPFTGAFKVKISNLTAKEIIGMAKGIDITLKQDEANILLNQTNGIPFLIHIALEAIQTNTLSMENFKDIAHKPDQLYESYFRDVLYYLQVHNLEAVAKEIAISKIPIRVDDLKASQLESIGLIQVKGTNDCEPRCELFRKFCLEAFKKETEKWN